MSNDKKHFPEGFIYKEPHPNAPDFVKGSCAIKVAEFQKWLSRVKGEWVNLDFKVSKEGKPYAEVNTFKPEKKSVDGYPKSSQQKNPTYGADKSIPNEFDDMDDGLPF